MRYSILQIITLIFTALIFISSTATAQDKLLFSGFAFSGNYENRKELYPYSSKIEFLKSENGQPLLNKVFNEKIKSRPNEDARLTSELGRIGQGNQITVAFALTYEKVEYMELDGHLLLFLGINANVLAFDRASKQLIAAYPLRIRYHDTVNERQSDEQILTLFKKLYLTNELGINPFDEWLNKFSEIKFKGRYTKYLQVKNIDIEPEALKMIALHNEKPKALKNLIANELESSIASTNNIPIIPWSPGEVVGRVMALRFCDGNTFMLNLPNPDYEVDFTLRAFRGTEVEGAYSLQKIYRTLGTIKIYQPDIKKYHLNENIYNTQIVTLAKAYDAKVEDWEQYKKTLNELLYDTSKQFSSVNSGWIKEHASRGAEAIDTFRDASKIIDQLK
ncbi:MAG: hypothetical protein HKK67_03465 [Chlorobiaceae bacterium]|nr:hypothetical protein [Chlorobiaceae bacterium]